MTNSHHSWSLSLRSDLKQLMYLKTNDYLFDYLPLSDRRRTSRIVVTCLCQIQGHVFIFYDLCVYNRLIIVCLSVVLMFSKIGVNNLQYDWFVRVLQLKVRAPHNPFFPKEISVQ